MYTTAAPQIDIQTQDDELKPDYLDLDPVMVRTIQERAKAILDKNMEHTHRAVVYS